MFEIVNFRYFNNVPVIVSCEKEVQELLDIDEAVGSRNTNGLYINLFYTIK